MNIEFLKNLSNADGIASNEKEVRQAILAELEELPYEKQTDGLGSLIFTKKGKSSKSIMICGHMDEVGFMVRSISNLGLIHLMVVGGVKPIAQHLQKIRITTFDGKKSAESLTASIAMEKRNIFIVISAQRQLKRLLS